MINKCSKCGFESEGNKFCPNCGQKLVDEELNLEINEQKTANESSKKGNFALAGMIIGIVTICLWFIVYVSTACANNTDNAASFKYTAYSLLTVSSIVGLVFSCIGVSNKKGFGVPGIITNAVAVLYLLIYWCIYFLNA